MGSIFNLPSSFSPECNVSTPPLADIDTTKYFSRWSNANVSALPAAVIVPAVEEDVVIAINFARENGFKLIPASGTHGPFVPIDDRVIYLDMTKFNDIEIDEQGGTIKMGGGTLTGDVLEKLSKRGLYTNVSNSNQVGMVGYALGGGQSIFNGLHGFAMDIIRDVRIITASGRALELDSSSTGEEGDLFNVIAGAGYGFGVITSITFQIWRIKDLGLDEDKLFTRQAIFPGSEIQTAAELFERLQAPPSPETAASLVCLRAPGAPMKGEPLIMVFVNSLGPARWAEKIMPAAFEDKYTTRALVAKTAMVDFADMNHHASEYNSHGDYKENHGVWSDSITAEAIVAAYESWIELGESVPSAKATSSWVIAAKNPAGMFAQDKDDKKFFPRALRNKKIYTRVSPWWTDPKDDAASRSWARKMVKILGPSSGEKLCGYAANMHKGIDMGEIYQPEQIEKITQLSKSLDPTGLFWNPVVDGV